jgi:hypothetical protein
LDEYLNFKKWEYEAGVRAVLRIGICRTSTAIKQISPKQNPLLRMKPLEELRI